MYLATGMESSKEKLTQRAISASEAARLRKIIAELQQVRLVLEGELVRRDKQQQALDKLYGPIPYGQWRLIPARVILDSSLPYSRTQMINAGHRRGVIPGAQVTTRRLMTDRSKALPHSLAVISSTALVGELTSTGAYTAEMRLVTDSKYRTRAKIYRVRDANRPRAITVTQGPGASERPLRPGDPLIDVWVHGDGINGMIVPELSAYENVRVGDWLVSVGSDAMLPAQLYIGQVSEVVPDPKRRGLFVNLKIKPHTDLSALREVYVVLPVGARPLREEASR